MTTETFKSSSTKREYYINPSNLSCITNNVVYLFSCKACSTQYSGSMIVSDLCLTIIIIITTILLSKLWYICSVFPLPKDLLQEINKIIYTFLWNNKNPEPIARETLFLPRERGGLGILVPSIESQALRTKYLLQLGKENNTNIWTYLGRYWVASKIHNFTPEWNFLKRNTYPKNCDQYIPKFYNDIIRLTKTNIKEIKKKQTATYIAL